eukprot:gene20737-1117_t
MDTYDSNTSTVCRVASRDSAESDMSNDDGFDRQLQDIRQKRQQVQREAEALRGELEMLDSLKKEVTVKVKSPISTAATHKPVMNLAGVSQRQGRSREPRGAPQGLSSDHLTPGYMRVTARSRARSKSNDKSQSLSSSQRSKSGSRRGKSADTRRQHVDPHRSMREEMREGWTQDSTLTSGYFLMEDNKVSSFGKEKRFSNPVGTKNSGVYYLGSNMSQMQDKAKKGQTDVGGTSSRLDPHMTVTSHWNDTRGGVAPGPGAYHPRYSKLSKPPK